MALTTRCTGSLIEASATEGVQFDLTLTAVCESSSSLNWSLAEGESLPMGLEFLTFSGPSIAEITGMATSLPDPDPTSLNVTVSDADGDVGHILVYLTVNQ